MNKSILIKSKKISKLKISKILGGWATFFSCIGPDWGLWEYNFLIDLEWSWAGDSNEKIKKVPPVIGSRDMS